MTYYIVVITAVLILIAIDLDAKNNNSVSEVILGNTGTLTCTANSSQPCSYTWYWVDSVNEEVVSNGSTLIPLKTGWYKCEAECYIRHKQCTVVSRLVHVSDQKSEKGSISNSHFSLFLWVTRFLIDLLFVSMQ